LIKCPADNYDQLSPTDRS